MFLPGNAMNGHTALIDFYSLSYMHLCVFRFFYANSSFSFYAKLIIFYVF